MFDRDLWREIFQSINKNKLRSILSGFTITFAILIFTILFGITNGLKNTFKTAFVDDADNTIFVQSGKTSKPYKGNQIGKRINFSNKDFDYLNKTFEDKIQYATSRIYKNFNVSYKGQKNNYQIIAAHPDHQFIEKTIVTDGRYLNYSDLSKKAKVVVIGKIVYEQLFKNKKAVGKYINLQGISYKVIGVFEDEGGDREESIIYIPITTAQSLYSNNDYVNQINIAHNPNMDYDQAIAFGNQMRTKLKERFVVSPKDQRAIRVNTMAEGLKGTGQFMMVLGVLVFFIGAGTLIAGIVGISNIMVYIVKERTKELGIRKVMGASPKAIISLILLESITITSIAGYLGILIGMGSLHLIGDSFEKYFIKDPSVNQSIVITAVIILIIAGALAGYVPAKKASKIKPIVALRAE